MGRFLLTIVAVSIAIVLAMYVMFAA